MNDSIFFWNTIALEVVRLSHTEPAKREQNGPVLAARALAIVHLAMYDAYAAIVGGAGFPRYLNPPPVIPVPPGTSPRDAVAGAAQITLNALYPAQTEFVNAQLAIFDFTNPSYVFGRHIGNAVLGLRSNDLDARDCGYRISNNRGRHRVDPDNPGQGFHAPYYGAQTRGFAISTRHGLNPPPFANGLDPDYLLALRDVRAKGIRPDLTATLPATLFANRRTHAETLVGIYWAYDGAIGLGIPERLYNQIVRKVAGEQGNNEGQNARLFAFVNAAMADAAALAWEQKYCHDFWRPVVGIREHDETLGPAAPYAVAADFNDGDPGWLPLGAPSTNAPGLKNFTPNFPAYPSGHATIGAAALHITRMFYGVPANDKSNDTLFQGGGPFNIPAWFVSDELNGGNRDNDGTVRPRHTRFFPGGLWQAIVENAQSRIFLGVHWIFDAFDFTQAPGGALVPDFTDENIGGVGLGLRIARDIFATGSGLAPRQTPSGSAVPPIITPPPNSPMPALPTQPSSVGGCVSSPAALAAVQATSEEAAASGSSGGVKGSAKKAVARVLGKKGTEDETTAPGAGARVRPDATTSAQGPWPSGVSDQDQDRPSTGQGAWPSGISEK
jgi:membrane-associated phospholipid phosphatase